MLPSGTVTLLLADVEGSTRLWEADSRTATSALAELNADVNELVAKFGGVRPLEQGEGDSFVAAFARTSDAIACAIELQAGLADGRVRVRMALHTGEIDESHDGRITGRVIIRAARMRDLAHGGQVLVSAATREAALDTMPEGADLIDLGSHPLKSLDRPEHIYQLTHEALRSEFPPLRSPETAHGNIPVQLTTFVGREDALAEVARLVEAHRLVTLTGAGGCGKTRLAVEVATRIAESFAEGAWFCDLGPLVSPDAVAALLCTVIGAASERHPTDVDAACARLAGSNSLIVFDNCEHLIEPSAVLVDALLRRCPRVRIVTTSREPLGVEGEVAWRVPSLSTPERNSTVDADKLSHFEAIQLFVERAAQSRPGFALSDDNASAIAEICSRLDGIPLAIQLAAARVRVLSLDQIAAGLSDRFRFLGRGARTLLPRQQTLEASVRWSHDLLSEPQRVAFRRLAGFSGRFSLEAAEHVVSGEEMDPAEVLEVLSQLVDRSLVVTEESSGGTYYRLLETVRHFARERLVEASEPAGVGQRHLDWYVASALRCRELSDGGTEMSVAYAPVEAEYDNIRAACEWAVAERCVQAGLRLVSEIVMYTGARTIAARFRECLLWLEELLHSADDIDPRIRANAFMADSLARGMLGDIESGIEPARRAVDIARTLDDPLLLGKALLQCGMSLNISVEPEEARSLLEESAANARAASDGRTFVIASFQLAMGWLFRGELDQAYAIADELCVLGERGRWDYSGPRLLRGACLLLRGEVAQAVDEMEVAAVGIERSGDVYWVANAQAILGWAAQRQGRHVDARAHLQRSREAAEGFEVQTIQAELFLARTMLDLGDDDEAMRLVRQNAVTTERLSESMVGDFAVSAAAAINAMVCLASDRFEEARAFAAEADDVSAKLRGYTFLTTPNHTLGAIAERRAGEIANAESRIARGLERLAREGSYLYAPDALDVAAALRADVGADADAGRLFAAAREGRRRMGTVPEFALVWDADAEIAALRTRMDNDAFMEAWTAGEALSLEEAVAYAMRGRGARQRPQIGWDSLTPTERQVVDLVAAGLSNKQVAEKLFISPRTVSTHLSHIFAKLGVSSRAELASAAAKRAD